MSSQALLAPPSVFHLAPPYERFEAVPDVSALTPADLPDASVLAVTLSSPEDSWGDLAALVPQLRAGFPAAPVVLRVGWRTDDGDLDLVGARALGIRAVLFEGEPPKPRLRRILTDATTLPDDLERWLPLRLPSLAPELVQLACGIVRLAPRFTEVGALLGSIGHAERTVRTWLRRAGVPGPGKWLAAAHAVRAALRLQAEERAPLLTLAVDCGYSDHSSLSRQSLRLFGVRPGAIRGTLGWEWLLDRWLTGPTAGACRESPSG